MMMMMMMMMSVEHSVERLVGETEVLGRNLSRCSFVYHSSHVTLSGLEPETPRWDAGD
jgi:hypothetical protein